MLYKGVLKIHVDKYHVDNNLPTSSTSSSTDSITKLLINLIIIISYQLSVISYQLLLEDDQKLVDI
jgi:hypothetical protein